MQCDHQHGSNHTTQIENEPIRDEKQPFDGAKSHHPAPLHHHQTPMTAHVDDASCHIDYNDVTSSGNPEKEEEAGRSATSELALAANAGLELIHANRELNARITSLEEQRHTDLDKIHQLEHQLKVKSHMLQLMQRDAEQQQHTHTQPLAHTRTHVQPHSEEHSQQQQPIMWQSMSQSYSANQMCEPASSEAQSPPGMSQSQGSEQLRKCLDRLSGSGETTKRLSSEIVEKTAQIAALRDELNRVNLDRFEALSRASQTMKDYQGLKQQCEEERAKFALLQSEMKATRDELDESMAFVHRLKQENEYLGKQLRTAALAIGTNGVGGGGCCCHSNTAESDLEAAQQIGGSEQDDRQHDEKNGEEVRKQKREQDGEKKEVERERMHQIQQQQLHHHTMLEPHHNQLVRHWQRLACKDSAHQMQGFAAVSSAPPTFVPRTSVGSATYSEAPLNMAASRHIGVTKNGDDCFCTFTSASNQTVPPGNIVSRVALMGGQKAASPPRPAPSIQSVRATTGGGGASDMLSSLTQLPAVAKARQNASLHSYYLSHNEGGGHAVTATHLQLRQTTPQLGLNHLLGSSLGGRAVLQQRLSENSATVVQCAHMHGGAIIQRIPNDL